jgi:hypothetical protein
MSYNTSNSKLKQLTGFSFIIILIPILMWALWNYCFNAQSNQADRVKMYHSYFPELLHGRYTISLVCLLLSVLGIILSSIHYHRRTSLLKFVNTVVLTAGILMTLLFLFSLM